MSIVIHKKFPRKYVNLYIKDKVPHAMLGHFTFLIQLFLPYKTISIKI